MLGNDPRGFSLGEVYALLHPWRSHHFDIKCACGVYPCPVWERLLPLREKDLYARLFDTLDLDLIVDSSKRLTWVIDQNIRISRIPGIRCRNIVLYKDPTSLYYSYWKRGLSEIERIPGLYGYYRRAIRAGLPMVAVNYDWFVANVHAALALLCEVIEIPYFEEKSIFWGKVHHHLFGSFGTRKQLFERPDAAVYQERFDDEFERKRPEFERRLAADPGLASTLELLRQRDIRTIGGYPSAGRRRLRRPWFYYRDRIEEIRRSRHPEPYPDLESSLIREWRR